MFITVRFGDNRQEIFNPNCKVCVLLDNIKDRCDCQKEDIVDLSDQSGEHKNLRLNPMDYAIKYVDEREILILIKIERFPGSLNDTCVPLLHSLQGDKDFLQTLNYRNLNEVPNSQDDSEKQRPSRQVLGRRASMNIRKQKNSFAVGGAKRSTRTTRSQSIAIAGGVSSYPIKLFKKAR